MKINKVVTNLLIITFLISSINSALANSNLKQCEVLRQEILKTIQKTANGNIRLYQDLLFDCDDYAQFVSDLLPDVDKYIYGCWSWGGKPLAHAVNIADCLDNVTTKRCVFEPQSATILACWDKSLGLLPGSETDKSNLCSHIGVSKGWMYSSFIPSKSTDIRSDPKPRACADWRTTYESCWNCCEGTAKWDGRANREWLNHCKIYCWGKPGTPNEKIPKPLF